MNHPECSGCLQSLCIFAENQALIYGCLFIYQKGNFLAALGRHCSKYCFTPIWASTKIVKCKFIYLFIVQKISPTQFNREREKYLLLPIQYLKLIVTSVRFLKCLFLHSSEAVTDYPPDPPPSTVILQQNLPELA